MLVFNHTDSKFESIRIKILKCNVRFVFHSRARSTLSPAHERWSWTLGLQRRPLWRVPGNLVVLLIGQGFFFEDFINNFSLLFYMCMYVLCICTCRECCLAMVTGTCSDMLPWQRFTAYGHTALRTRLGWQIPRQCDIFLFKFSRDFMKNCFLS